MLAVLGVLLLAGAAAGLLLPDGDKGNAAPPSPIALEAVGTEDPAGDGEHDGEVGNAVDENAETYWTTSRYSYANGGFGKEGVGLRLAANRPPSELVVESETPGFTAEVRSGEPGGRAVTAGRGEDDVRAAGRPRRDGARPLDHEPRRQPRGSDQRGPSPLTAPQSARGAEGRDVLFADLVGSTTIGEADPESVRVLLDRFFAAMAEEVERVGGTVEKFAGDAVMAAFGAPAALEDHAERALHAALAMRERLAELDPSLALRIGVNTGEVVVDADAHSTFVTGDAVNVCARLEQGADPGQIVVGERTAQAARGAFEFGDLQHVDAKGKSEPVACRLLVQALATVRPRGAHERPFVGRRDELEALRDAYERAVDGGEPQLAIVFGEAGVGKSRLLRELGRLARGPPREPLAPRRQVPFLRVGEDVLARPGDPAGAARRARRPPDPRPCVRARRRRRPAPAGCARPFPGCLGRAPERGCARGPLVLLVEDVHWAEAPLLELLERTVRDVRGPLLVVATARPELEWGGGRRHVTAIELEPLADEVAAELVADLPEDVRDLLVQRSEGNPFFVEELIESLVDSGVLAQRDERWRSRRSRSSSRCPTRSAACSPRASTCSRHARRRRCRPRR